MKSINKDKKVFFFLFFALILVLSYLVAKPYLMLLVLAFAVSAMLQPLYRFLKNILKDNKGIASATTLLVFLIFFIVPLLLIANLIFNQTKVFYNDLNNIISDENGRLEEIISKINTTLQDFPVIEKELNKEKILDFIKDNLKPIVNFALDNALNVGKFVFDSVPKFVIFLFFLSTFIPIHDKIIKLIRKLSPLDEKIDNTFIGRFLAMTDAMIKGSFIIAVVQGVISGLALSIAGVPYITFWTLLMIFLSIIPLGSGILTIPIGLIQIVLGGVWQGVFLILNHFLVITNIDNFLRPKLVKGEAKLHPILTLVGALGGIHIFGFLGVIFGPVVMILLVTTIEVYMKYYRKS